MTGSSLMHVLAVQCIHLVCSRTLHQSLLDSLHVVLPGGILGLPLKLLCCHLQTRMHVIGVHRTLAVTLGIGGVKIAWHARLTVIHGYTLPDNRGPIRGPNHQLARVMSPRQALAVTLSSVVDTLLVSSC